MECLEFTNYLECGAKIPPQIQMCSQITANRLRVTFWYLFIHQLSLTFFFFFPVGPLPLMALFLETSFRAVSNASESLEQQAWVSRCQAPPCQLHRNPGQRGEQHLLVGSLSLSPSMPTSPKLRQTLSKSDPVTLKRYISVWVLCQRD